MWLEQEPRYWRRRTLEEVHIQKLTEANQQLRLWSDAECDLDPLLGVLTRASHSLEHSHTHLNISIFTMLLYIHY